MLALHLKACFNLSNPEQVTRPSGKHQRREAMSKNTYPRDDAEFEEVIIAEATAREASGGWEIKRSDGWIFFVPKDSPVAPAVGMTARFYGKGIGFTVRGLFLDGVEVFYRTEVEDKAKHRADAYGLTAADLIAKWDRGETIWSIELGGMGPGYEQAIQVAAVEMAREGLDVPLEGTKEDHGAIWREVCDRAIKRHDEALGGLSGAMYGAAAWLSWRWVHGGGPAKLIDDTKARGEDDRCIQVSKSWPHAPA
jgi:hypothetical protein